MPEHAADLPHVQGTLKADGVASLRFFASAARGLAEALEDELRELGASGTERRPGGVAFDGDLALGYRACLWSRIAGRVLLVLATATGADDADADADDRADIDPDALYALARAVPWSEHLGPDETIAVDVSGRSRGFDDTRFAALRVKDAIVDALRAETGRRPDVDTQTPDLRVHAHLAGGAATLSLDLSGGGLHRRGYRERSARAPLRETLAAALLRIAGYGEPDARERALLDPMCGSGTLVVEAALWAADTAPGLLRAEPFGFERWAGHDQSLWRELLDEARRRDRRCDEAAAGRCGAIVGRDADAEAVRQARAGVRRAGVEGWVDIEHARAEQAGPPAGATEPGLLITNPPYGERIGHKVALERLYLAFGDGLRARFGGWTAHVLSADPELSRALGLKAAGRTRVFNGALECRLLRYPITAREAGAEKDRSAKAKGAPQPDALAAVSRLTQSDGAAAFANRLRKNARAIDRWARRASVEAYRVYDADLPDFAVAVDRYGDKLHIAEYAPPRSVDAERARARLHDAVLLASTLLEVDPDDVYVKVRQRQRGTTQYERHERSGERFVVGENGHRFYVNLADYLDTGLFLDHRDVRAYVGEHAAGKHFLNLFCYTATATVYAARAGAASTTSVDLSRTYLDWARDNLVLNDIEVGGRKHRLERGDVARFLERARADRRRYDLIFCDPPTFSNSKAMEQSFDVQRDHPALLAGLTELLAPNGVAIFSTHQRRFRLDADAVAKRSAAARVERLKLLPRDFARSERSHFVYKLSRAH